MKLKISVRVGKDRGVDTDSAEAIKGKVWIGIYL